MQWLVVYLTMATLWFYFKCVETTLLMCYFCCNGCSGVFVEYFLVVCSHARAFGLQLWACKFVSMCELMSMCVWTLMFESLSTYVYSYDVYFGVVFYLCSIFWRFTHARLVSLVRVVFAKFAKRELIVPFIGWILQNNMECTWCFSEDKDACGTWCSGMCETSGLCQQAMLVVVLRENSGCVSIRFVTIFLQCVN